MNNLNTTQIYEIKEGEVFEKPLIPDDFYEGTIIKIENTTGSKMDRLRFIWRVQYKGKDYDLARSGNLMFSTSSKLGKDLLSLGITKGQKFDIQGLIGKKARLLVKQEDITRVDGKKQRQSVIKEVWALPKPS